MVFFATGRVEKWMILIYVRISRLFCFYLKLLFAIIVQLKGDYCKVVYNLYKEEDELGKVFVSFNHFTNVITADL